MQKRNYFNKFQILRKLRALPVGKLQSSFNVAGSWADMVTFFFLIFFLQKFKQHVYFYFEGSLSLETNGGLMVFKSIPAKEPKVRVCSFQLSFSAKLGRLGLTFRQDKICLPSFIWTTGLQHNFFLFWILIPGKIAFDVIVWLSNLMSQQYLCSPWEYICS